MEVPVSMNRREARLGWVFLALEIFVLPRLFPMVNALLPKPLNSAQLNFAFFATNFLVVLLIFHDFLLENLRQFRKNIWKNLVVIALGFSLYTFVSALMGLLIDHFVPEFVNANDANVAAVAQNAPLLMGLGTAVLVPPTEETLFRGLLFGEPARKNKLTGWVVSTGIFALVHVTGYIGVYTPPNDGSGHRAVSPSRNYSGRMLLPGRQPGGQRGGSCAGQPLFLSHYVPLRCAMSKIIQLSPISPISLPQVR